MGLEISVPGHHDVVSELLSLRDWLRADYAFDGTAELPTAAPATGEMGAVSEVLNVATSPETVEAFLAAVSVWLKTRKSNVTIRIRDGELETEMTATNVDDPKWFAKLGRDLADHEQSRGPARS